MKDHAPGGRIEYRDEYAYMRDHELWLRTSDVFDSIHELLESSSSVDVGTEYSVEITAASDRRYRTLAASYSDSDLTTTYIRVAIDYERIKTGPRHEICDLAISHGISSMVVHDPNLRGELTEQYMFELYDGGSAFACVKRTSNLTDASEFTGTFDMTSYDFDELEAILSLLRSTQNAGEVEAAVRLSSR